MLSPDEPVARAAFLAANPHMEKAREQFLDSLATQNLFEDEERDEAEVDGEDADTDEETVEVGSSEVDE